jgi:hypothetical protein
VQQANYLQRSPHAKQQNTMMNALQETLSNSLKKKQEVSRAEMADTYQKRLDYINRPKKYQKAAAQSKYLQKVPQNLDLLEVSNSPQRKRQRSKTRS